MLSICGNVSYSIAEEPTAPATAFNSSELTLSQSEDITVVSTNKATVGSHSV